MLSQSSEVQERPPFQPVSEVTFPKALNINQMHELEKKYNLRDKYYGVNRVCHNCKSIVYIYIIKGVIATKALDEAHVPCATCECDTIPIHP